MAVVSTLNQNIMACAEAINVGTVQNPKYIGWLPGERSKAGVVLGQIKDTYPLLIQYTDGHSEKEEDTYVLHKIDFYMITPKPKGTYDVLTVMELHDNLSYYCDLFVKNIRNHYDCYIVGDKTRLVDGFSTVLEAGLYFTLSIKVFKTCLT